MTKEEVRKPSPLPHKHIPCKLWLSLPKAQMQGFSEGMWHEAKDHSEEKYFGRRSRMNERLMEVATSTREPGGGGREGKGMKEKGSEMSTEPHNKRQKGRTWTVDCGRGGREWTGCAPWRLR